MTSGVHTLESAPAFHITVHVVAPQSEDVVQVKGRDTHSAGCWAASEQVASPIWELAGRGGTGMCSPDHTE